VIVEIPRVLLPSLRLAPAIPAEMTRSRGWMITSGITR